MKVFNRVKTAIDQWAARVLGAVRADGAFAEQPAEYESNRTSQDYLWNTVGTTVWGMLFPLLTIVVTQLVGVEQAGMFSLAFVAASLLMIVGNYGVRTYQVSDRDEEHSFFDYQVNRWVTCLAMLAAGAIYSAARGYTGMMQLMAMSLFAYKMVDALADCYEGRLQQCDKLYLAGISQTIRSGAALVVFSFLLLVTRDLGFAATGMAVVAGASFVLFTLPLALLETPRTRPADVRSIGRLFAQCAPVFVSLFLYALVDNMPKFLMEGTLSYDNQLYFNALYFPAQAILLVVGFLYKPMLGRMADAWMDLSRRGRFNVLIGAALLAIAAITAVVVALMAWIGIPVMGFLYGIDFEPLRHLAYLMVIAGGLTGGIDFLYQVFTVMRRQAAVAKLYLIALVFAVAVGYMLIHVSGLRGAVIGYLIVMAILLVLLVLEYARILMDYRRHPEDDPTLQAAKAKQAAASVGEGAAPSPGTPDGAAAVSAPAVRSAAAVRPAAAAAAAPPDGSYYSARESARQKRIAREGGEVDPRYRARHALEARRRRRDAGSDE